MVTIVVRMVIMMVTTVIIRVRMVVGIDIEWPSLLFVWS